jgi:hypothetical protein
VSQELTLTSVRVGTATADEDGRLVIAGDLLVAVLVRLAEEHEEAGHWFLEHGFGRLNVTVPPTFSDLQAAEKWIASKLSGVADSDATLAPSRTHFPTPRILP